MSEAIKRLNGPEEIGGTGPVVINGPGGMFVSKNSGLHVDELATWFKPEVSPQMGSLEDQVERRERLFEILRDLTPQNVLALMDEYRDIFPPHPAAERQVFSENNVKTAALLGNLEGYTFDPDRVVAMCKAAQDACRQTAEIEKEGPIHVIEAGFGLGYVAMAALALNEELGNRIKVTGLELGSAIFHRGNQVMDYFGIPKEWTNILHADATNFDKVPPKCHVLVAEHLNQGVFSNEPIFAVLNNLVSKLANPKFIIPAGIDIYGRAVRSDAGTSDSIKDMVHSRLMYATDLAPEYRAIEEDEIERLIGGGRNEVVKQQLLMRMRFAEALNSGWDGNLRLSLKGVANKNEKAVFQLRGVPIFHTDIEGDEPVLQGQRFYANSPESGAVNLAYGTILNWWASVRDRKRVSDLMRSGSAIGPAGMQMAQQITNTADTSPRFKLEKKGFYSFDAVGPIDELAADVSIKKL